MRVLANYLTLIILFLLVITYIIDSYILDLILASLTIIVLALALLYANRINKIFASIMLTISICLLLIESRSVLFLQEAIIKNLPLITLIVLAPMLAIPVKIGKYDDNINNFILKHAKTKSRLYLFISFIYFVLSPLLNMGSLPLIHSIITKMKLPSGFLGRVYLRSFFATNMWAPYFASVFLVIYYLNIPFNDYVIYGLILAITQLIVSYFMYVIYEQHRIKFELSVANENVEIRKIMEFIIVLILIILTIFISESIFNINMSIIITMIIVLFTLIWSLYLKEFKSYISQIKYFFNNIIPSSSNEIVLFLSAGIFGALISTTIIGAIINEYWLKVASYSILLTIFLTIITTVFMSFIGTHQVVTITIFLTSVTFEDAGISSVIMAMTLLGAYSSGGIISPVSPANIVVSRLINENIYHIIIKYNLLFALIVSVTQTIVIYIIYIIL